jgi:hypothetical protein
MGGEEILPKTGVEVKSSLTVLLSSAILDLLATPFVVRLREPSSKDSIELVVCLTFSRYSIFLQNQRFLWKDH